ncbi:MAG: hypothetical protein Kow00124_05210 [Anaerolineae bacterium]
MIPPLDRTRSAWLAGYFDEAAANYAEHIEPAFGPLAAVLVRSAGVQLGERVLDLGTGSGAAARHAAALGAEAFALDFSPAMLAAARRQGTPNLLCADMHALPLASCSFDVVLAAFAFNSTDPTISMAEARRVLKPGGRLALHEWGTEDALEAILNDTLAAYAVEDPPPDLALIRERAEVPLPWDTLESMEDIVGVLRGAGFVRIRAAVINPTVWFEDARSFMRYKLAWPIRQAELRAMPPDVRSLCLSDLEENLGARAETDGRLRWQPNVVQIMAYRRRRSRPNSARRSARP